MTRYRPSSPRGPRSGHWVLAFVLVIAVGAGSGMAASVWCSPFETDGGVPVIHQNLAAVVDNTVGGAGESVGGVASLAPMLYIQHGQILPGVPAAIDPSGAAGAFCISTPDDRRTGINPNIPSNVGNLAGTFTFEGYFLLPSDEPLGAPTDVARRLVTQKRSAADNQSRSAVGIHAGISGGVDGLIDYEGFNYTGVVLGGMSGGTGWGGNPDDPSYPNNPVNPWTNPVTFDNHLSDDGISIVTDDQPHPFFPFTVSGSRVSGTGGHISRALSQPIDLASERTIYLSALMRKTSIDATAGDNLEIGLATSATVGATASTIRLGMTSPDRFFIVNSAAAAQQGTVVANVPYFVVVKIESHAAAPDRCYLNVYTPGDTVPTTDPGTDAAGWLIVNELSSSALLTHLKITIGASLIKGEVDEIRVGATYASVIDPAAPQGVPAKVQNLLATYWAEAGEGEPPAVINHLELGKTPVTANAWHHFAMVYDGTEIRWYLDGTLEGTVVPNNFYVAGPAFLGIGNLATTGTGNRGWFGLLDEIRIWDRALTLDELAVKGGGPGANLLWRSSFETNRDQPVTHLQPAEELNCIDNSVGPPDGSPAGIVANFYVEYGQTGAPAIPDAIDPADLGGQFALSMPNQANVAINTNVPSNIANLNGAMTIQGYFNTTRDTPVAVGGVLGSRLVSQLRSASEGQSRLAIGLAPNTDEGPTHNVLGIAWANITDPGPPLVVEVREEKGTTAIQPGNWYHFALVWDGTDIRWYLDGQLEGQILAPNLHEAGTGPIIIGNDRFNGGTRGFYGLIDKVIVSDHATEPAQLMIAGLDGCVARPCNLPFADMDNDEDVDQLDFSAFQLCYSGSGIAGIGSCLCLDRDGDDDIDADDLVEFLPCVSGPSIAWSQAAAPNCDP